MGLSQQSPPQKQSQNQTQHLRRRGMSQPTMDGLDSLPRKARRTGSKMLTWLLKQQNLRLKKWPNRQTHHLHHRRTPTRGVPSQQWVSEKTARHGSRIVLTFRQVKRRKRRANMNPTRLLLNLNPNPNPNNQQHRPRSSRKTRGTTGCLLVKRTRKRRKARYVAARFLLLYFIRPLEIKHVLHAWRIA